MTRGDRPEVAAPPEIFYNEEEARKYTTNSRMISIQVCDCCKSKLYQSATFQGRSVHP